MAIEVREAMVSDVEAFRSLRLAALRLAPGAYRMTEAEQTDTPLEEWEGYVVRHAADPDAGLFMALVDDLPAGIMVVGTDRRAETMSIEDLWVDPVNRRRGVAHAMVVSATEWGCRRSARIARLAVNVTSEAAERLFLECEFVPTGETEPLREGSDETVAWMERTLIS